MEYKELSRRGLIRMCQDFDKETDDFLHSYLDEYGHRYEKIRFVEKVTDKCDDFGEAVHSSFNEFTDQVLDHSDKLVDSVIGTVTKKGIEFVGNLL